MKIKKKKWTKKRILKWWQNAWYLIYSTVIGSLRLVSQRHGKSRKNYCINDNKTAQRQLEELKRHNYVMEVYFAPYKTWTRTHKIKKKKK